MGADHARVSPQGEERPPVDSAGEIFQNRFEFLAFCIEYPRERRPESGSQRISAIRLVVVRHRNFGGVADDCLASQVNVLEVVKKFTITHDATTRGGSIEGLWPLFQGEAYRMPTH